MAALHVYPLAKLPALAGSQPLPLRIRRRVTRDQPFAAQPPAAPALPRLVREPGILPCPPLPGQRIVHSHRQPLPRAVSAPLAGNVGLDLIADEARACDCDCEVKVVEQARVRCGVVCVLAQVCHGVRPSGGWGGGECETAKCSRGQEQRYPAAITPWWRQRKPRGSYVTARGHIPAGAGCGG